MDEKQKPPTLLERWGELVEEHTFVALGIVILVIWAIAAMQGQNLFDSTAEPEAPTIYEAVDQSPAKN